MMARLFASAKLAPAQVDVIACGVGPGPFTGLRVGVATAVAMGVALHRPVVGVSTLDTLAYTSLTTNPPRIWRTNGCQNPPESGFWQPFVLQIRQFPGAGASAEEAAVIVATRARRVEVFYAEYAADGDLLAGPWALPDDVARERIAAAPDAVVAGDAAAGLLDPSSGRLSVAHPDALALADLVHVRVEGGEPWPEAIDAIVDPVTGARDLDPATSIGAGAAEAVAARRREGQVLLPARPLYLRRPDAVPSVAGPGIP